MPTTQTPVVPVPPPSGEALYDWLMGRIEPELVTNQLPLLEQKYAAETETEKTARSERYTKAFDAYDKAFAEYNASFQNQVSMYKKTAMKSVEAKERQKELAQMAKLEASFQ